MAAMAVVHDHLFHGQSSPPLPHQPHIKQRSPPLTSRCACAFSSPTTFHLQHHHHHRSATQLPTSPKCIPSSSDSQANGPTHAHFRELFNRSMKAGDYGKAFYYLQRLVSAGHRPSGYRCTQLIAGLCSTSPYNLRKAEMVIEILELHRSISAFAYGTFLTALCRLKQVDAALSFLPRMRRHRCPADAVNYSILIKALCSEERLGDAVDVFNSMPKVGLCRPDVVTYSVLIDGHIAHGCLADAVKLLEEMLARGPQPNSYAYNSILKGMCKEGLVDQALQLLRRLSTSTSTTFPNVVSYNVVLKGLLEMERWGDANALVAEMATSRHLAPNVRTYNLWMRYMFRGRKVEEATGVLDGLLRRGLRPNKHSLAIVTSAYCKIGRMDLAVAFLERMVAGGYMPNIVSYNAMMTALCKSGKVWEALEVLRKLEGIGCKPDASSFNMLIDRLWACGERRMALQLVQEMLREGIAADNFTFNTLISCLCGDGMVKEAMDLLEDMEVVGPRPNVVTYNTLLRGLCRARRVVDAIEVFVCEMMGLGTGTRWKSGGYIAGTRRITRPDDSTYAILLEGIALEGHIAEAAELANALIASNVISREYARRLRKTVLSSHAPSPSSVGVFG